MLQKNIHTRDIRTTIEKLKKANAFDLNMVLFRDYATCVIHYILQEGNAPNEDDVVQCLSNALPEREREIMTIAQQLIQRGEQTGWRKGHLEGEQTGWRKGHLEGEKKGWRKGRLEGRKEGHQEGRQEGHQEGHQEERLALVKTMLSDHIDLETIARYMQISLAELKKFCEQFNLKKP